MDALIRRGEEGGSYKVNVSHPKPNLDLFKTLPFEANFSVACSGLLRQLACTKRGDIS
jgi:hypothetical protein